MRRDFVNGISEALGIERRDLIEKDLILHQILLDLSKDRFFHENFLFKGGTCLIKCYLGYFRFSEDIDFTWKDQEQFKGMSQKEIRKYLSSVIDETGAVFEEIAQKRRLDFKCIKSSRDYVELGGGNKTATLKIWYDSEILNRRTFFKVQINFVEEMHFPAVENSLKSLLVKPVNELKILFPEESRKFVIEPEDLKEDIIGKIRFMFDLYEKYRDNFNEKKMMLKTQEIFAWGNEKALLLEDMEEKEFYSFLSELTLFLQKIVEEIEV